MKNILTVICLVVVSCYSVYAQIGVGRRTTPIVPAETSLIDYAKPKEYTIGGITSSGSKYYDASSMLSISGLVFWKTLRFRLQKSKQTKFS